MATGLTEPSERILQAVRPVLSALAQGTPSINADDVEDLTNHVVEKVLRRLGAGAQIRDLEVYAKQAARHAFYDQVEQRGALIELEPKHDSAEGQWSSWLEQVAPLGLAASPSEQLIAGEDALRHQEAVIWALQQLSSAERSILVLRHSEGLDGKEIAEQLGYKSAAVVDTTAARARTKLERHLSPSLLG